MPTIIVRYHQRGHKIFIRHNGLELAIAEWAKILGVSYACMFKRVKRGPRYIDRVLGPRGRFGRPVCSTLTDVILECVRHFPVATGVLYDRVTIEYGALCKRRFYRYLRRMTESGALTRTIGKHDRGSDQYEYAKPRLRGRPPSYNSAHA